MQTIIAKHLLGCCAFGLLACTGGKQYTQDVEKEGVATMLPEQDSEVTVEPLKRQTFYHELVSNGKLSSADEADLYFEKGGVLARIYVKNGQAVRKGDKLAELEKFSLNNATLQAEADLENARLELKDVLIGQGYPAEDSASVPPSVMKLARVKSGYDRSLAQYQLARHEEECATLTAPFDGVVANLFSKPFNTVEAGKVFCTVVGSSRMEADFTVLENELALVKPGDKVVITPYADAEAHCEGRITEVNPQVDEKGMVKVKATVQGRKGLFSGMNVRVNVHRELDDRLVVPKSAVVLRSGRQVVFTLKNGRAQWNYVQTGLENSAYYTLVEGGNSHLQEGDTLIVTGNVNLAHEAAVEVKR